MKSMAHRRHKQRICKARARAIVDRWGNVTGDDRPRIIGMMATSPKLCTGYCCCNRRRQGLGDSLSDMRRAAYWEIFDE